MTKKLPKNKDLISSLETLMKIKRKFTLLLEFIANPIRNTICMRLEETLISSKLKLRRFTLLRRTLIKTLTFISNLPRVKSSFSLMFPKVKWKLVMLL
jgi:hypothetical protein